MLAEGQSVNLVTDSMTFTRFTFDRDFYVERTVDGVDLGEQMLSLGWAIVPPHLGFDRLRRYEDARGRGKYSGAGAWELRASRSRSG